jgi:hypothetical protein
MDRTDFEATMRTQGYKVATRDDGTYLAQDVQDAWEKMKPTKIEKPAKGG